MDTRKYADELDVSSEFIDNFKFEIIPKNIIIDSQYYKLYQLAECAEKEGDLRSAKILYLLGSISSLKLKPNSINAPYAPLFNQSFSIENLTNNDLTLLRYLLKPIVIPELKSRITDILWLLIRPKNLTYAYDAIDSYSSGEIDEKSWKFGVNHFYERGVRLAIQLRSSGQDKLSVIEEKLIKALLQYEKKDGFMYLWLCDFYLDLGFNNSRIKYFADKTYSKGLEYLALSNHLSARAYLELSSRLYASSEQSEKSNNSLFHLAKSWAKEGNNRLSDSGAIASEFYNNAIQVLRKIPIIYRDKLGVEYEINKLRLGINEANTNAINQMVRISHTFSQEDIHEMSSIASTCSSYVSNVDSVVEAIYKFVTIAESFKRNNIIDETKKIMSQNILTSLMPSTLFSNDARIISKTTAYGFCKDSESSDDSVMNQVFQNIYNKIDFIIDIQILPALKTLLSEHRIPFGLLLDLCHQSPLIPSNRQYLFAKSLHEGFEFDFSSAIYLLTPQLENLVRVILKSHNILTTTLDLNGIEMEVGLSTLLDKKEATDIFDENLLFEFKVLLTDPRGPNLRNDLAHGLLCDGSSSSNAAIYVWWRTLKLVVESLLLSSENS